MAERQDDAAAERRIVAEPLAAPAFAPFGEVIAHRGEPGRGFVPTAFMAADGARPHLWVNRVAPVEGALVPLRTLERHPFSAQNFLPLRGGRWLVVVAESDPGGRPRFDRIRAFVTDGCQGVSYRPGVWHHGLLALDLAAEVAVVMGLTGRDDDTEIDDLPWPVVVRLPPL
jgi:ureidoglycolate lyase